MGLFGDLDAATVSSNPFFIAGGEYESEVINAEYRTNRDGIKQLFVQWQLTQEDSPFKGQKPQQYYPLVEEGLTNEKMELLPSDEQAKIRKMMADLKRALCGNDGNKHQPGMGVDPDDLNDADWSPSTLIGTKGVLVINNFGPNNQGVGIKWFNKFVDESDSDV